MDAFDYSESLSRSITRLVLYQGIELSITWPILFLLIRFAQALASHLNKIQSLKLKKMNGKSRSKVLDVSVES